MALLTVRETVNREPWILHPQPLILLTGLVAELCRTHRRRRAEGRELKMERAEGRELKVGGGELKVESGELKVESGGSRVESGE